MKRTFLLVFVLSSAICGCAIERPHAVVNDVSVRQEFDSGYTLVAVDGKPVERAHGKGMNSLVDYVPFAWVEPGTHSLTLKRSVNSNSKIPPVKAEVTITATLEANKRYRFDAKEGTVTLVDDFN